MSANGGSIEDRERAHVPVVHPRRFDRLRITVEPQLAMQVERYLQTVGCSGPAGEPVVRFGVARSADIDTLLCRMVLDGEDVRTELGLALELLREDRAEEGSELSADWSGETAARLHQLDDLEDRLIAYARAYWCEERETYGFSDLDQTDPPAEWGASDSHLPEAGGVGEDAPGAVDEDCAATVVDAELPAAVACPGGDDFLRQLEQEVTRGHRGLGRLSILFAELASEPTCADRAAADIAEQLDRAREVVVQRLRPYDVCGRTRGNRIGVILPGTTSDTCAAVVGRVRRALDEVFSESRIAVGAATWPDDGLSAGALCDHAAEAIARDRRRRRSGEVEFDSIPAFMVEDDRDSEGGTAATLWLAGLPEGLSGRAESTGDGLRLRAPLAFLRAGTQVRFRSDVGPVLAGKVKAAFMGQRSPEQPPVLQLEIVPPHRGPVSPQPSSKLAPW